jgi:hypothetical protein
LNGHEQRRMLGLYGQSRFLNCRVVKMLTQVQSIKSLHVRLRRVVEELALIRAAFATRMHPYCPIDNVCVVCHRTPNQPSFRLFHDRSGMITQTTTTNESVLTLSEAHQEINRTKVR